MKQKDIALILVVAFISGVLSIFISRALFSSPKQRQEKVEIVDVITPDFEDPDKKYFNGQSVNPTKLIQIGEDPNQNPFGSQD